MRAVLMLMVMGACGGGDSPGQANFVPCAAEWSQDRTFEWSGLCDKRCQVRPPNATVSCLVTNEFMEQRDCSQESGRFASVNGEQGCCRFEIEDGFPKQAVYWRECE